VLGRLATDRPIVARIYGAYSFRFGTQIGAFFNGSSGTPMSRYVNTLNGYQVFVNGRGDMGRSPVLRRTDLLVSHTLTARKTQRIRLELNFINLFNQKTATHIFNTLNRGAGGVATARPSSAINLSNVDLAKGYDYQALFAARKTARTRSTRGTANRICFRRGCKGSSASSSFFEFSPELFGPVENDHHVGGSGGGVG
jgi:hypothetical protein